jgi:hypothetical protein
MSYSTNYAGLKADLLQNNDDYSSEFMAHLDTIIAEAETKVLRDLDLGIFQDEFAAGSLTQGTRTFTRPAGVVKINAIWLTVSGSRKFIEKRDKGYCEAYGEDATQARPLYWAEHSETELYFVGTPDAAYPVIAYGIVRPDGLSEATPTTWLSTNAGDLLFTACKIRSEQYLRNPNKAGVWDTDYSTKLLPAAKIELRGMTRASYEAARVVAPPSQTL